MARPTIISKVLNRNEFLELIEQSKANFVSTIQYDLPDFLSKSQPFDYYNIFRNHALRYCLETVVLNGIGKYSLKKTEKYFGLVRADDVVRELTREEVRVDYKLRGKLSEYNSIEGLLNSKPSTNYHEWINDGLSYRAGLNRLVSVIFSSFITSDKNFLDVEDMQDFVDALSIKECRRYCITKNTIYYFFSAEKGEIKITELSKKDLEINENLEEKQKYIGKVIEGENGIFFKAKISKYRYLLNGFNLGFNPWN